MVSSNNNFLSGKEILDEQVYIGVKKGIQQYFLQSVINGCMAGAFLSLGAFAAFVASHGISDYGLSKLVNASIFPVGLILIVICGAELFTSNTLLIQARLAKKISSGVYLGNLAIIYVTNALGALSVAMLIVGSGVLHNDANALGGYVIHTALIKIGYSFSQDVCSGVLCNILVCSAAWGAAAAKDVAGKILIIWFAIMAFILGGFEHCVANMFYFSLALLAKLNPAFTLASKVNPLELNELTLNGVLHNIIPVTLGNIIGGAIFVGAAYWVVHFRGYKKTN